MHDLTTWNGWWQLLKDCPAENYAVSIFGAILLTLFIFQIRQNRKKTPCPQSAEIIRDLAIEQLRDKFLNSSDTAFIALAAKLKESADELLKEP